MKIFVPGGAGFIGNFLCEQLLALGHNVLCLDNLSLGTKENIHRLMTNPNFEFVKGDILDESLLKLLFSEHHPQAVFHMAANSDIQAGSLNIDVDIEKTLLTTTALLKLIRQYPIEDFIFASSSAIYGPKDDLISETAGELNPISFYGAGKLASEAFISAAQEFSPFKSWIFRFPNVIGPYLTHGVIYDFINKLSQHPHSLEILGDGKQTKPYMHVSDLVSGMLYCWKHSKENKNIFNLSVSDTISVTTLADIVTKELGLNDVLYTYTGSSQGWKGDVPYFQYDTTKITKLGWKTEFSSAEAIRRTVREESFRIKQQKGIN